MSHAPSGTADELFTRGNQAADRREWAEAARLYEEAIRIQPKHVMALNNLGYCHFRLEEHDLGVLYFQRCLTLKHDLTLALFNIVEALESSGRKFETIPYLRRLVELQPESGQHAFKLANLLSGAGRTAEALFYYRQAFAANPRHQATVSNYLLALNYADGLSVDYIAAEHFRLGSMWSGDCANFYGVPAERVGKNGTVPLTAIDAAPFAPVDNPQQPLRIAYLSGDFHTHPDGKTLAPIMAAHDRCRHVVFAYSDGRKDDAWTAKACELRRFSRHRGDQRRRLAAANSRRPHRRSHRDTGPHGRPQSL